VIASVRASTPAPRTGLRGPVGEDENAIVYTGDDDAILR
jgi:hypothetical protein